MSFLIRFTSLVWVLLVAAFSSIALQSCGSDNNSDNNSESAAGTTQSADSSVAVVGPQPLIDSTYVIKTFQGEPAFKAQLLPARRFYRERGFRLGWFKDHQLVKRAEDLQAIIAKAAEEGLNPKDYQVKDFKKLFGELNQARSDTARRNALEQQIDVALTGTYMKWANDYYRGIANPRDTKSTSWQVKPNKIKLNKALATFLGDRKSRYNYYEFAPLHPEYDQLKKALATYRAQERAGGWPLLPANLNLKPGQSSPAVALLRKRLLDSAGGEAAASLPADSAKHGAGPAAYLYDPEVVAAVKLFQQDAGLKPTGIVSGETLRQLNVPIGTRIDQLILNMERWRWLPKKFEPNYLLVNIPEYTLHVVEDGKEAFNMPVIVGKVLHETPVFSDKMEYVVLAPYWNVPFSIIDNELRDKLVADPHYLDRLDMEVVKGWGRKATPVDPASVDWANVTQSTFKYTLRRRPGPKNDLGDVKFLFPNSQDIYLHDTPHDELFSQSNRSFSHGCVRVAEPIKLATYLLRNRPEWDRQTILDSIATRHEKYITLKEKLPVYLVYFTAWADAAGHPHFRDDIYGLDKKLAKEYFN
ncbi:L,D-transpeptidase family protein [Hymenobacter properus]|uniref:L,D-transpeptidase family protein n=1 Tax=Hymenobacter properus TaxID=2791026 RepID=A0A931BFK8_9BACT|nr:L,D-transpeptidase family protein [Hymenobacter properus]MBF9140392.1 L,D-transpeptidase family protein [Hymenobacter properus]MBR7719199.1 L,D-transpeptidase family protein [Microvirga sp. SRT04]